MKELLQLDVSQQKELYFNFLYNMVKMIRIVLCGDGATGKTTLTQAYLGKEVSLNTKMTIGIGIEAFRVQIPGDDLVHVVVYDLGGQEQFRQIRELFLTYANVIVLVFDRLRTKTFIDLEWWMSHINERLPGVPIILVENKIDAAQKITEDEIKAFMEKYPQIVGYVATSALQKINVDQLFTAAILIALGMEYDPSIVIKPIGRE